MYRDPQGIRRLAWQVAAEADDTRSGAVRAASAASAAWQSTAAGVWRARLEDAVGLARSAARELDELEAALVAHASAAQHRLDEIAAAQRWFVQQAHEAQNTAARAVEAAKGGVGWLEEHVVDGLRSAAGFAQDQAEHWQAPLMSIPAGSVEWVGAARRYGWHG